MSNIGMGPAIHVEASIEFGDVEGNRSAAPLAEGDTVLAGISHTEPWVALTFEDVSVTEQVGFRLTLRYQDVAGNGWITEAR